MQSSTFAQLDICTLMPFTQELLKLLRIYGIYKICHKNKGYQTLAKILNIVFTRVILAHIFRIFAIESWGV
jgi:hypothetical protein